MKISLQIALQFIISGGVVTGASIIAKHIDSKWSGLLVALPIMTILGYIFISTNTNEVITKKYLLSALIFLAPAALYIFSLYYLHGRISLLASLIIAVIPLALSTVIIQKFI